ncbi:MAG: hypothetical protein JKY08_02080 [Flavobacteriaceae bacterium]|nr:hypothetical protein [Flavobacteriaceae bacterium]
MKNKFIFLLVTSFILCSCNTVSTNKQLKLETIAIAIKNESIPSDTLRIKITNQSITDRTNYITECFYKSLVNGKQSFEAFEKSLLKQNILKKATPKEYKDLFIRHYVSAQFAVHENKNTLKYYQQRLQIATLLKTHIIILEKNAATIRTCFEASSKKENFKNSSTKALIDKMREIHNLYSSGKLNLKSTEQAYEVSNSYFSNELFLNTDSRVIIYANLYMSLKSYDKEQMELDYSNSLKVQNVNKNQKTSTISTKIGKQKRLAAPELIKEEDEKEFVKNGGKTIESKE